MFACALYPKFLISFLLFKYDYCYLVVYDHWMSVRKELASAA